MRRYFEAASTITTFAFNGVAPNAEQLEQPFGSAVCIIAGDRTQTVTVTPGLTGNAKLLTLVRSSPIFRIHFAVTSLTLSVRQQFDNDFDDYLGSLAYNEAAGPDTPSDRGRDKRYVYLPRGVRIFTAATKAYEFLLAGDDGTGACMADRFIIAPHHDTCDGHNKALSELFSKASGNEATTFVATHELVHNEDKNLHTVTEEWFQSASTRGVPSALLMLAAGDWAIITRNINPAAGLQNGTRVRVVQADWRRVAVRKASDIARARADGLGEDTVPLYYLPRIKFHAQVGLVTFWRRQFPLRLACASSAEGVQGQTGSRGIIDLTKSMFEHGAHSL